VGWYWRESECVVETNPNMELQPAWHEEQGPHGDAIIHAELVLAHQLPTGNEDEKGAVDLNHTLERRLFFARPNMKGREGGQLRLNAESGCSPNADTSLHASHILLLSGQKVPPALVSPRLLREQLRKLSAAAQDIGTTVEEGSELVRVEGGPLAFLRGVLSGVDVYLENNPGSFRYQGPGPCVVGHDDPLRFGVFFFVFFAWVDVSQMLL
jgi:hypothetical protein